MANLSNASVCASGFVGDRPGSSGDRPNGRDERARTEEMTIRPLDDHRYVVETGGGTWTYVVTPDTETCTCPDHAIRGVRCKHLRRVALDAAAGVIPVDQGRVKICAVCGVEVIGPITSGRTWLCATHGFEPGEAVFDRETGSLLIVTRVTHRRSDEYETDGGQPVIEYPTNTAYGPHEPVVEAVYADAVTPGQTVDDAKQYGFPASRLVRIRQTTTETDSSGTAPFEE